MPRRPAASHQPARAGRRRTRRSVPIASVRPARIAATVRAIVRGGGVVAFVVREVGRDDDQRLGAAPHCVEHGGDVGRRRGPTTSGSTRKSVKTRWRNGRCTSRLCSPACGPSSIVTLRQREPRSAQRRCRRARRRAACGTRRRSARRARRAGRGARGRGGRRGARCRGSGASRAYAVAAIGPEYT